VPSDPSFFRAHSPIASASTFRAVRRAGRAWMRVVDHHVVVDGALPASPCVLATNATARHDFLSLWKAIDDAGLRVVSVSKAKNHHPGAGVAGTWRRLEASALASLGTVPLASRGYLLLCDFEAVFGRLPTAPEYRRLRDHVDGAAPIGPGGDLVRALCTTPRTLFGVPLDRSKEGAAWRELVRAAAAASFQESVRLARIAVAHGRHVHIYPEGTVSPRRGPLRSGAVQLARALDVPLVPIGMSGCAAAYRGGLLPWRGAVHLRVGRPISLDVLPASHRPFHPDDENAHRPMLEHLCGELGAALDALVDPELRAPVPLVADLGARAGRPLRPIESLR
jgi:1-acyl-sn-glycerol-3-phosphate acyltransferase